MILAVEVLNFRDVKKSSWSYMYFWSTLELPLPLTQNLLYKSKKVNELHIVCFFKLKKKW